MSSWTESLKALPARERLAWQKAITADAATQEVMPKQGPISRAYASGGPASTSKLMPSLESYSSTGQRLPAVTGTFSSTAEFLASSLYDAFEKAGVPLPVSFRSTVVEGGADPLVAAIRTSSLDAAYLLVVCKALQRRLVSDSEWIAERSSSALPVEGASETSKSRFPHLATLADGSLVKAASSRSSVIISTPSNVGPGHNDGLCTPQNSGTTVSATVCSAEESDMLDSVLNELMGSTRV